MSYFTSKQKRQILIGIRKIYKDMDSIVGKGKIPNMRINLKYLKPNVNFELFDCKVYDFFDHRNWNLVYRNGWIIEIKDEHGRDSNVWIDLSKRRNISDSGYLARIEFIERYPENRKVIEEVIQNAKSTQNELINGVKSSLQELDRIKSAAIELDFTETLSQKEIEVEKKDGQTIGTINFGERSIHIITNGDIALVPKREKEKQKVKSNS